jgi:pyruvate,water dikinase
MRRTAPIDGRSGSVAQPLRPSSGQDELHHNGSAKYIVPFDAARNEDPARLGGKCAGLVGLTAAGAPVPGGYAITTDAYTAMLQAENLAGAIGDLLAGHDPEDVGSQAKIAGAIRQAIVNRPMPPAVEGAIRAAYRSLCAQLGYETPVAVRSSGSAEDLPEASFAGQGDTYLWIIGESAVVEHVKSCWASLYNARALAYRAKKQLGRADVKMGVAVQQMVDAAASGVAMTLDPSNGDRSKIFIEASWGLGELVVSGEVTPDQFVVDKVMLEAVRTRISSKTIELVANAAERRVERRVVGQDRERQPSLSDEQLRTIAKLAKAMERHFGCPQDIEWAIDRSGNSHHGVVLLQSRPETVWSQQTAATSPIGKSYAIGIEGIVNTLLTPVVIKRQ